jgi:hypothetical protein
MYGYQPYNKDMGEAMNEQAERSESVARQRLTMAMIDAARSEGIRPEAIERMTDEQWELFAAAARQRVHMAPRSEYVPSADTRKLVLDGLRQRVAPPRPVAVAAHDADADLFRRFEDEDDHETRPCEECGAMTYRPRLSSRGPTPGHLYARQRSVCGACWNEDRRINGEADARRMAEAKARMATGLYCGLCDGLLEREPHDGRMHHACVAQASAEG